MKSRYTTLHLIYVCLFINATIVTMVGWPVIGVTIAALTIGLISRER